MPADKAKRKSYVLRMDPESFRALERWAGDEFRSLNGQIEYLLHQALARAGRLPGQRRPGGPSAEGPTPPDAGEPEGGTAPDGSAPTAGGG
jgi:hypothetical protein